MLETIAAKHLRLGEVLIDAGHITHHQLEQALYLQETSSGKKRLGEVLIESGIISEDTLLTALSKRLNISYASISDAPIDLEAVSKIPKSVAVKHCLIAVNTDGNILKIYINDPLNYYAIEDVKLITHMQLDVEICKKSEIERAINANYSELETQSAARGANETVSAALSQGYIDISEGADDTPVVTLINSTLYKAHNAGASDVHIEPFENHTNVRIRVDGQIVDYLTLSSALHNSVVARVKILSGLDIAEKRAPQDGHFRARLQDIEINVRVSTMPTVYGEKIVMRFMSQSALLDNADTFGMDRDDYQKMLEILQVPHGLIYITGPTGSGKTTTLYMIMEMLAKRFVNISTIEDPVEKNLAGINQTQINPLAGLTFESGLRSILRQDPDIIMIGETRDSETASISVRAALTGHLVLSSLHTNDSVSAIVRLLDMGIEEYLLANSLAGVVAQRLVKKICNFCAEEYVPTESELRLLGDTQADRLVRGKGCHNCNNTGYKGRLAIHEILAIDSRIRNMISQKASTDEIYRCIEEKGSVKGLLPAIQRLAAQGKTSLSELMKLTYYV
ncbi:MAG: Flp pilus assembly complex ATPase component TadA [Oscillospiraceae bacterium]|nr:Flp pilus assembly complex ATPase component TadA [Oscillospiraceae bacterium]